MPALNGRGQVGAGVAGGIVNIDNVAIATGGGAVWLTDDLLLFNGPDPDPALGWVLREYDLQSQQFTRLDTRGGNFLAAGGGLYAVQANAGVYANFPFASGSFMSLTITDGRGAASPAGLVALCDDSSCTSFSVYDATGKRVSKVPAVAYNLQIVSPTAMLWDGGSLGYFPVNSLPLSRRRAVELSDGVWIVGYANGIGLVAQLDGATDGYILTSGLAYHHDARAIGGELVVCWSTSASEAPGTNVVVTVDRTQPRVTLPPTPVVVIPTFHFDAPVLTAVFKDPNHETTAPMEIVVNNATQQTTRPAIVAVDSLTAVKGPIQGLYSEAVDPTADLSLARQHNTRLFLAHDAVSPWTIPAGLRPFDVPVMECYLAVINGVKETADQAYSRCLSMLNTIEEQWNGPVIGLIPMFYCEGGAPPNETFTVGEVCAWLQYFSKFVNGSIRTFFLAPFEYLRANGVTGHPELQQALDNLLAEQQRVGVASLPPIPSNTLEKVPMQAFNGFAKVVALNGGPYYTGVDPSTHGPHNVYYNRPGEPNQGGEWEELALTPHDDGGWDAKYVAANVGLSIQDDGTLQSRPAGTYGPFENLQVRTESGTGRVLLYRTMGGGSILLVEVKP